MKSCLKIFKKKYLASFISILLTLVCSNVEAKQQLEPKKPKTLNINSILELKVNSSINPATYNYLLSGYEKAERENYSLILIKMNTPGGLVSTTKDILTLIGNADIPTIIWITPEGASATSAGAIIASGAHILVMSKGTNIGAATPIQLGQDIKEGDSKNKAINDLVALVQSLATARGRSQEHFAKMIKEAASYSADESLKHKLIDGIINNEQELFKFIEQKIVATKGETYKIWLDNPKIDTLEMDLGQKLLNILANPNFAYILFIIGAALLYFELQAPGGLVAGAIGAVCLILAGIGFQVLPLNFGALGLIALSFLLFVLEAYIVSYGLLTISGLAALLSGSLFLFRTDDAYISMSKALVYSTCSVIGLFIGLIMLFWVRDSKRSKDRRNFYSLEGLSTIIIAELETETEGYFYYQVKIEGEIWKAYSPIKYDIGSSCTVKEQEENNMILKI